MSLMKHGKYFLLIAIAAFMGACDAGPNSTGRTFMPDMQYSRAYEAYTDNTVFEDGMTARKPVEGSIPRGYMPYHNENTNEGYQASASLKNPVSLTDKNLKEGGQLYTIYCQVCHGATGNGDGRIVEIGPYPPPPPYNVRLQTITEGQMFHSITYGKNLMGAYGSQLTPEERWQVIFYIQKLGEVGPFAGGATPTMNGEVTASADTTTVQE